MSPATGSTYERVALRVVAGVAATVALGIGVVVIAMGTTMLHGWLEPGLRGLGQGEGVLAMMLLVITPVFGVITAIHLRIGLVLSALFLLAVLGLYGGGALGLW